VKLSKAYISLLVFSFLAACTSSTRQEEPYYQAKKTVLERSDEDRAKSLTELGLAYYKLGKYSYALENLERSLTFDKNNAVTYQLIALINMREKQAAQAQLYFDKALQLAPENFDIVTSYAAFLYGEQRDTEALREFKRIINAPFYHKKWVAYTYLGLYDLRNNLQRAAEIKFYKALQFNKTYALALLEMAKIRYQKQELMSARAYIERYFSEAGKTLVGLELAIKIERGLQDFAMAEQYELELKRAYPFSEAAEALKR
jgi:type IV pilus assembly protein PilF